VLKRLVRLLLRRWPTVTIDVRAESDFAVPGLYDDLEDARIPYTMALVTNQRLSAMAQDLAQEATEERAKTGETVRLQVPYLQLGTLRLRLPRGRCRWPILARPPQGRSRDSVHSPHRVRWRHGSCPLLRPAIISCSGWQG
jgi:hypothetical protein